MTKPKLKTFITTRNIFYLMIFAVLFALALYAYVYFIIQKTGQSTATLQQETSTLEAEETQIGQLRSNLASTEVSRGAISSFFIAAGDIVPFLETIEKYGKDTGVTVSYNNVAIEKTPNRLDVTLMAKGTFTNLYRFTALVETAPYEIIFTDTNLLSNPSTLAASPNGPPPATDWSEGMSISVLSINGVQ